MVTQGHGRDNAGPLVARVIALHPKWEEQHCEYLNEALSERGEEQVHTLTTNEAMRLAPMATFWAVGLGSGLKGAGKISPLTFSLVVGLQYVSVAARTYEIVGEQERMKLARTSMLSGQMDEETWLRYMNSAGHLEEEMHERDEAALEAVGMSFAAAAVARITTYGLRGAWAARVTPAVVGKYRYSAELFAFLEARGVRTAADIEKLLASASPREMKEIRRLVRDGYEMTLPALAIALKETLHSFNFSGYDVGEFERGL